METRTLYKIIATDLDGTILQNGIRILRDDIQPNIKRYLSRGGIFLPASGRQYYNLRRMFDEVADDIAYIAENGCLIFYRGELLHRAVMDRKLGLELCDAIDDIPGAKLVVSGVEGVYIREGDRELYDHIVGYVKTKATTVKSMRDVKEEFFKISAFSKEGVGIFEDRLKSMFSDRLNVVTSGLSWTDVMPKGVHKGSAIRILADRLGIPLEDVAALGDHYNDMELLEAVGYPVCVDNAMPEIKALCKRQGPDGSDLLIELLNE